MHDGPRHDHHAEHGSIRATITAMVIAFVCVLIFRAFVVEAFIIPTGSMAPTLLGRHARLHSPQTGATWAVGASPRAGLTQRADADDPYSTLRTIEDDAPLRSGDRISVCKPACALRPARRWSVVVFKNPENPPRTTSAACRPARRARLARRRRRLHPHPRRRAPRIARKPDATQRALWWTIFSSEHAPLDASDPALRWRSPWLLTRDDGQRLDTTGRVYRLDDASRTTLRWDNALRAVTDATPYNDAPTLRGTPVFPTGDVRVRLGVRPDDDGFALSAVIAARSHEWIVEVRDGGVRLASRRAQGEGASERWTVLDERRVAAFAPGRWSDFFALVDQAIEARLDGRVTCATSSTGPLTNDCAATGLDTRRSATSS